MLVLDTLARLSEMLLVKGDETRLLVARSPLMAFPNGRG
jgi:hypothetical protein